MKNKSAEITLVAVVMLILTAILVIATISAVGSYSKKSSQVNRIDSVYTLTNEIVEHSFSEADEDYSKISKFTLASSELYLFFSAGGEDIYLSHLFTGDGKAKIKDKGIDLQEEHYLKFERPDEKECLNSACVCYCPMALPPWIPSEEQPYLNPTAINLIEEKSEKGFSCSSPVCMQVGDSLKQVTFGNSRGHGDEEYVEMIVDEVETSNKQDRFYPIPMDISLIIQNEIKDDGNFIFGDGSASGAGITFGDSYNYQRQDGSIVKLLLEEYAWENGIVIGGTATSVNKAARKDKRIQGVPITIKMESKKDAPGIMGICLHENCLYEKGIEKLKQKQKESADTHSFAKDAKNEFIKFNAYLQKDFVIGLDLISKDSSKYPEFIKTFRDNLQTVVEGTKAPEGINSAIVLARVSGNDRLIKPRFMVNDAIIYEGEAIPVSFPFKNSAEQFETDIVIVDFDGTTVSLHDGSKKQISAIVREDHTYTISFEDQI